MNKRAIVIVCDDGYISHAKSLVMNATIEGKWSEDFAFICPLNSLAATTFQKAGFAVLQTDLTGFFQKFLIFDRFFKQWESILYLDCDVIINNDLQRLFALLDENDKVIYCDTEDGLNRRTLPVHNREEEKYKDLYESVTQKYPHIDSQIFNTAFLLFKPEIIKDGTVEALNEVQRFIEPINHPDNSATDQQPINLLMWEQMKKIPRKLVCFFGLAEPHNDVDSEYRQFKKGDIPVAIHFSRWYAQWIYKEPETGAHWNFQLNEPNHDIYKRNLKLFDEKFGTTI